MEGKRFLRSIRLQNILSFGPDTPELPLEPLNVLIGPNASGKSNLIEAISLLAAAPRDLQQPIREGGGVHEWLWKGVKRLGTASLDVTVEYTGPMRFSVEDKLKLWAHDIDRLETPRILRYRFSFGETGARFDLRDEAVRETGTRFDLRDEVVEDEEQFPDDIGLHYRYREGRPVISAFVKDGMSRIQRHFDPEDLKPDQSILSQRRDPGTYPEVTWLADKFERMDFYRDWNFGRSMPPRAPQSPDLPNDFLLEDASNIGLVLNQLQNWHDGLDEKILKQMRTVYPSIKRVMTTISGGRVQVFFHEDGLRHPVPAPRLSDGTLRYLCLLSILCHPEPPPVICLEEPELGLHPDIIPEVAKLLVEASTRTQLFVTTHSDILVNALSDTSEAVIVCEKLDGATLLQRLDAKDLKPWLEKYRLGDLWIRGDIGGTRW